ncbi:corticotropin-releasing factor receptor 2 isoform X2 [Ursus arctos]|uniref:corticotropin-releasing factor receptor 2 isoform X2 n=1 Tax=Ursus arctos TaxID=9644 RepID=UPI0025478C6D|nr:corticotropin-releasing factor receptor 2 isoform X2 [Ursus arctos]
MDQPPWALLEQYCHVVTTLTNVSGPYSYCNTTLDQIGTCWPRSAAGALVERPCPEYFNGVKYNTTRNAYRECLENGTWASRINYSQCEPILDDKQRKYDLHYRIALVVNYLGHCVSVAALVAAFLLFLVLRSIRCLRNVIHWNLITTFILRNVVWFLLQLIDHEVHESNEVWCRCVTTIFNYFVVTNFFWMFVEGCYLHTAVVMTYSTERLRKWLFLFIGWCIPCPIIIAWAIGKLYYENEQCWFGKEPGDLVDYIYQGPIILVLLIHRLSYEDTHTSTENRPPRSVWRAAQSRRQAGADGRDTGRPAVTIHSASMARAARAGPGKRLGASVLMPRKGPKRRQMRPFQEPWSQPSSPFIFIASDVPGKRFPGCKGGMINFVFLFNIVRILMTKLRASTTSETIQYRKAVKATLVLLPLLGITYMLFFVNPGEDDLSQIVFIYFNSFLQSFQGFFVSVFYCFFNGEVRSAVRKRWHRWQDHHSLRVPVARATSIPTSPTRISFHSIKQTAAL